MEESIEMSKAIETGPLKERSMTVEMLNDNTQLIVP